MRFYHQFGSFHPSVTVDGVTFTFEDYKTFPHEARSRAREAIVERCVAANVRIGDAAQVIQNAIRTEYQAKIDALIKPGRKASRDVKLAYKHDVQRLSDARLRELVAVWDRPEFTLVGNAYPAAVSDILHVWETMCETEWEKFERLVTSHDWYYSYSDDHRVWSAGHRHHEQITQLATKLGEPAKQLYNQKCPWLNDDGTQKKENV